MLAVTRTKRDLPLKRSFVFKPSSFILSESQESPGAVCLQAGPVQTLLDFGSTKSPVATSPTEQWQSSSMSL